MKIDAGENSNQLLNSDLPYLKKTVLVLRAVNHPLRQEIIYVVRRQGKLKVTDIYTILKLEQSLASQHLALLRRIGVVNTTREGKNIYYSVDEERLREIGKLIDKLLE